MTSRVLVVSGGNHYYKTPPLAIGQIFCNWEATATVGTIDTLQEWIKAGIDFSVIDWTYGLYGKVQLIAAAAGRAVIGNQWKAYEVYKKSAFKAFLRSRGFGTPAFLAFDDDLELTPNWLQLAHAVLGNRIVIKPESRDGLSAGVFLLDANNGPGVCESVRFAQEIQSQVILESFIEGPEYCVGYLPRGRSVEVLPPARVEKRGDLLDHDVKIAGTYEFIFEQQSGLSRAALGELGDQLRTEYDLREPFYINGVVTSHGELMVFDCGAKVGLSPKSYFPRAMAAAGYDAICHLRALHLELWNAAEAPHPIQR